MLDHATRRAQELDESLDAQAAMMMLPSFRKVLTGIRVYLQRQNAGSGGKNNVHAILRTATSGDRGIITLGPQFDKGPTDCHYYTRSGGRLSFGITLRDQNGRCSLIAYRFHFHLGTNAAPGFYRFDLNDRAHSNPLLEPRSHLHVGRDNIRLPVPVLSPLAVLDRIFYVIESAI